MHLHRSQAGTEDPPDELLRRIDEDLALRVLVGGDTTEGGA